ncbi:MAG: SsrA-binding protein SmpB [candidate division Zixibacteria bacterium]|nr:SsrA-binding protein SmpB [candidate division Zixibacteria bacterium]
MNKENKTTETDIKLITSNRKARHEYTVLETYEAGIELQGTEVKSLRDGKANLGDSYAGIERNEVYLYHLHISPYEQGNIFNHDPLRKRRLLLHREEIRKLVGRVVEKGLTLVPLKLYFRHGRAKVELALARGKKQYDRRDAIAEREAQRDIDRTLRGR